MRILEPQVFLIGETRTVDGGLQAYLEHVGAPEWTSDAETDAEMLSEFFGRICYRAFRVGMNPNVKKIREGNATYLKNIIQQQHGSVFEHAMLNFVLADVSRVFTHELITHRVGTAKSQESLRFVRLTDLGFWVPNALQEKPDAVTLALEVVQYLENVQKKLSDMFGLDDEDSFKIKKHITSAMRRLAPDGLATTVGWSINPRALRHALEVRTHPSAEEEMRLVFGKVGKIVTERYPALFGDYTVESVDGYDWYRTDNRKI